MLSKEELQAIRARYEGYEQYEICGIEDNIDFNNVLELGKAMAKMGRDNACKLINHMLEVSSNAMCDIPTLLDTLEEVTAERDEITKEFNKLADGFYTAYKVKEYIADRDKWKTWAQALERAIKKLPHKATNPACCICKHQVKLFDLCGNFRGGCKHGDYVGWQFDESRFAGGREKTNG